MAAPPDLINDPPSLICCYKDRRQEDCRSFPSIVFPFLPSFIIIIVTPLTCSIFTGMRDVTEEMVKQWKKKRRRDRGKRDECLFWSYEKTVLLALSVSLIIVRMGHGDACHMLRPFIILLHTYTTHIMHWINDSQWVNGIQSFTHNPYCNNTSERIIKTYLSLYSDRPVVIFMSLTLD